MSKEEIALIMELFEDRFSLLLESMETMMNIKLKPIQDDLSEVKQDVKIIKKTVKDTNQELRLLERRVTKLEATR